MATFGKTTPSATQHDDGGGNVRGSKYNLSVEGWVTKISLYEDVPSGTDKVKCAIYQDSGGVPGAWVATTNEVSVTNTTVQWNDYTFSSAVHLTAGNYWLVFLADGLSGNYHHFYGDAGSQLGVYKGSSYPTFPDPYGTPSYQDFDYNIYATYTTIDPNPKGGFLAFM